ncbi:redox-sensitive transcriptional activator SoxR [Actinomadura graeca]|uniref:Redox-sensitive transcriptional activator SoxR n=1 Tax=Actinomadura graeca TaxID=2750812 RepID=A0ABX8R948_9ACTN|nr:redox-sensitive transcriptional activator SoxR [Actinomadura graeca]
MTRLEHRVHELTVGQLAERSGVAVSALHFYEAKGLISSRRTAGNQRRFARDALRRVSFIKVSQRVGIPLSDIKNALATLPEERTPTVADWARLSEAWRTDLDARISQLERLRDDLTECIGCGCLSISKCALANPYDRLGDEGPGPRRLVVPGGPCGHGDDAAGPRPAQDSGHGTGGEGGGTPVGTPAVQDGLPDGCAPACTPEG